MKNSFSIDLAPDYQAFLRCLRREGTPNRVHFVELFLDAEIQREICDRYELLEGLDTNDPFMDGGGYCLGTGNSVANYIPVDHYLVMLDEGRKFAA